MLDCSVNGLSDVHTILSKDLSIKYLGFAYVTTTLSFSYVGWWLIMYMRHPVKFCSKYSQFSLWTCSQMLKRSLSQVSVNNTRFRQKLHWIQTGNYYCKTHFYQRHPSWNLDLRREKHILISCFVLKKKENFVLLLSIPRRASKKL